MNTIVERWRNVTLSISEATRKAGRAPETAALVAVSKTFPVEAIEPVIQAGQRVFGENRVQEAQLKWIGLKAKYPDIQLHLIGPLQSNKASEAVGLFDVIETVDRPKIAQALANEMVRQSRRPKLLVQVNTGAEPQKAGVLPLDVDSFLNYCRDLGLEISGLMCIPPVDEAPALHFALLEKIAIRNQLVILSMGMSADFETAIGFGATHVRVGSGIFGGRPQA
jgi:pyridoxal phosphate enzyme (YggS family)